MCKTSSPRLRFLAIALCSLCCPLVIVPAVLSGLTTLSSMPGFDFRLPLIITGWTCIGLASFMMLRTSRELSAAVAPDKKTKPQD